MLEFEDGTEALPSNLRTTSPAGLMGEGLGIQGRQHRESLRPHAECLS